MKANRHSILSSIISAPALRLAALALAATSAQAVTYTWDGSVDPWNSAHWLPGPVGGAAITIADTAAMNAGTVSFAWNDTFGNAGTAATPILQIDAGGTLASGGFFNAIIGLNMNGGTLLSNGGVNSPFGAFALKGTVTIGGTVASTMSTGSGSFNTISVGAGSSGGTTTFNVADVTGSSAPDLIANTVFNNLQNVASGITKTGAGTMQLVDAVRVAGTPRARQTAGTAAGCGRMRRHLAPRIRSRCNRAWSSTRSSTTRLTMVRRSGWS